MSASGGRAEAAGLFGSPAPTASASHGITSASVEEWAAKALPGETLVYHVGEFLIKSLPAVMAADRLISSGWVLPVQRRISPTRREYIIQKRKNAERQLSAGSVNARPAGARVDDEEIEQLMAVLRRLANFAKPCPSYRELARLAQLAGGAESARYRLKRLAQAERIKIGETHDGALVVTIVSSGRSTAR